MAKKKGKNKKVVNNNLSTKVDKLDDMKEFDNRNKEGTNNLDTKDISKDGENVRNNSDYNASNLDNNTENAQKKNDEINVEVMIKSIDNNEEEKTSNISNLKENVEIQKEVKEENNNSNENLNIDEEKAISKVSKKDVSILQEQVQHQKKKNLFLLIIVILLIILIMIFSVIFALMNVTKSVIINGVSVKNIDISNLSLAEAKAKMEEAFRIELNAPIKLVSKDYETTLNSSQIEFTYNVSKAAEDSYSYGRDGNIFENNYAILISAFNGKEIDVDYTYNKENLDYIVDDIESKIPGLVTQANYYIEGEELIITPGTDGVLVNKEKLKEEIINTILSADAVDLLENNTKLEIQIPIEEAKANEIDIDKIYSEIYTEPKDAYYEKEPFKIYAEVAGVDFAISKQEAKDIVSEKKEEYRIPLIIAPASKTINDIGLEAFPYLISEFSTKYDASNKNRSQNLAIAAGKINGTVLMPGEEFSFNQVVGKRTIQEGYKDAKIYQDGQVVDGLAGGICQISSTLYNAVVKANLEVTERRNHSFTTSYIKAGQDATVVYGVIDFKFKNSRTYPIKISASVDSGIAEFRINGIKEEVEYDISLSPVTTGSIPYTTQYIPDPSLAPGQQVVVQGGGNGLKVTTYKDTKLDGKLVSREVISTDTYRPMNAIIRVGP